MCLEKGERSLVVKDRLGDDAGEGEHGKTAVLKLVNLVLLQLLGVLSKTQRIEGVVT